jgi:drug/metabolite transporter (DMT)-like permease
MTSQRAWLPAYTALVLIWGLSFLFNSLALRAFTPVQLTWGRVLLGGATLGLVLLASRSRPAVARRDLGDLVVLAVTLSAAPFLLIALAQERITSILAGMLNATTPLWAMLFVALLVPAERPGRRQVAGVLVGLVGIGVLLGAWRIDAVDWVGTAAMLGATACYGFGSAWSRLRLTSTGLSGTALSAVQLSLAALLLTPLMLAGAPWPTPSAALPWPVVAVLMLGVFGAGLAYVLFWRVIRSAGALVATTVTYVIPLVSTAAGVLVLGEPLVWHEPVGAVVVLAGVALTQAPDAGRR